MIVVGTADGVDLTSRGRRKSKRVNTGVPMICTWCDVSYCLLVLYALYTWYEVRRCVFDCCIGRENVIVVRYLAVQHVHTCTTTTGTKARA